MKNNTFLKGISDGMPICLGYLSVAFAFGIFSVENGLSVLEALLISMTNVTSAGQLAAVPIIVTGGSLYELAVTQFVINLRYALMSVSLSQKLHRNVRFADKLIIAFVNTDEVFAVSASKGYMLKRNYMFGLIITPFLGWSLGTLLGAVAGNILPTAVISSLGIAIYAMFMAIVIPEAKRRSQTALCVIFAIALSCVFKYAPVFAKIPQGFVIIICACIASALFAVIMPVPQIESEDK